MEGETRRKGPKSGGNKTISKLSSSQSQNAAIFLTEGPTSPALPGPPVAPSNPWIGNTSILSHHMHVHAGKMPPLEVKTKLLTLKPLGPLGPGSPRAPTGPCQRDYESVTTVLMVIFPCLPGVLQTPWAQIDLLVHAVPKRKE